MAGDWLKMELELSDKPEVHYIAGALNLDPDAVVGKLFRVWCWFNKHTTDGNAHGVTFALLDRIAGVTGFAEAMSYAGWMEQRDKTLHMPNFERHTSESAKKRGLSAKRAANHRAKSNADSNAASVTSALPREEKRRDINTGADAPTDPAKALTPAIDPVKALFDEGVALLAAHGLGDQESRSLIGKLRQKKGDDEARRVIEMARTKSSPREYIAAAFLPKGARFAV